MKIAVIGGGPAGLYFAILMKKRRPARTTSPSTSATGPTTPSASASCSPTRRSTISRSYDLPSYRRITQEFAYWDDIAIHFKGTVHRIGGNGFCGCSRRTLLLILQERARELGVKLVFGGRGRRRAAASPTPTSSSSPTASTAASASATPRISSPRSICGRTSSPGWARRSRSTPSPSSSRRREWGPFIAHAYQYEAGASTWVFETDPETFDARRPRRAWSEAQSARLMERIFGWFLDGHPVLTNRSLWRTFPMIRNKRWVLGNLVLLGDAKATAHFSIGSGTKLAMEDAIALYEAFRRERSVEGALAPLRDRPARGGREDPARGRRVARLVRACRPLLGFRPGPVRLRRDDAGEGHHLRQPAPARARRSSTRSTGTSRAQVAARGFDVDVERPLAPMFQPFAAARHGAAEPGRDVADGHVLGGRRRAAATGTSSITARAPSAAPGLLFTEMTCASAARPASRPAARACGTTSRRRRGRRIVDFVHANSAAKFCLQLGHAGRKGATKLMWEGMDRPLEEGAWDVCSASPIPYFPDSQVPREIGPRRHGPDQGRVRRGDRARRARRLRHARAALRPRLPARELHLAADQPPQRRVRRLAREPPALPARGVRRDARGLAERTSRCRCASRRPTGPRAGSPATRPSRSRAPSPRPASTSSTSRPARRSREARPIYGRMFQTPFSDQIRNEARGRHDVRRQHHDGRPGQHHPRRRPRRPRGARRARTSSTRSSP